MIVTIVKGIADAIRRRRRRMDNGGSHVTLAEQDWNAFIQSKPIRRLLKARSPRQIPKLTIRGWRSLTQSACQIWSDLEQEGRLRFVHAIYPVMCLLLKGHLYSALCTSPKVINKFLFDEEPFDFLVHAVAAFRSPMPESLMDRVMKDHGHQLLVATKDGKTPLHIICHIPPILPFASKQQRWEHIGRRMLKLSPQAASVPDFEGSYAFHRACASGLTWKSGLQELMDASPHIIGLPWLGHSPLQLSAVALSKSANYSILRSRDNKLTTEQDVEHTETLFCLLRLDPAVVQQLI